MNQYHSPVVRIIRLQNGSRRRYIVVINQTCWISRWWNVLVSVQSWHHVSLGLCQCLGWCRKWSCLPSHYKIIPSLLSLGSSTSPDSDGSVVSAEAAQVLSPVEALGDEATLDPISLCSQYSSSVGQPKSNTLIAFCSLSSLRVVVSKVCTPDWESPLHWVCSSLSKTNCLILFQNSSSPGSPYSPTCKIE